MEFKYTEESGLVKAEISGRLDTTNAEDFGKQIAPLMNGTKYDIEFDTAELEYISSSGLRMMLTLLKSAKNSGGSLKILNMRPAIREVFDMTGFSKLFNIQ